MINLRKEIYMTNTNKSLVCRPCAEQNNWEIQMLNGEVNPKHFPTQKECEQEAAKLCEEYGCDYVVEEKNNKQK